MKSLNQPKLSIIMPVLNGGCTIEKALCSVIEQHYSNIELIVLDGGSKDNTVSIIKRYEKYITYWHSEPDGNPSIAVNKGIEKSTGDYIALLMSDDWYEPHVLLKVGEAIYHHPEADIITCGGRVVHYDAHKHSYVTLQRFDTAKSLQLTFYNIFFAASAICCRFIKKSLYQQIGVYLLQDDQGKHLFSNDKEFLLRALMYRAKDFFIDYLGHNYLSHSGSSTFSHNRLMDMKLCSEHMYIADSYLTKPNLMYKERFMFHYWYHDQSVKLVLYHLFRGEGKNALVVVKKALKKYHAIWMVTFFYISIKTFIKRCAKLKVMRIHSH